MYNQGATWSSVILGEALQEAVGSIPSTSHFARSGHWASFSSHWHLSRKAGPGNVNSQLPPDLCMQPPPPPQESKGKRLQSVVWPLKAKTPRISEKDQRVWVHHPQYLPQSFCSSWESSLLVSQDRVPIFYESCHI